MSSNPLPRNRWLEWEPRRGATASNLQDRDLSIVNVGATVPVSEKTLHLDEDPQPDCLARASAVLSQAGVRLMRLDEGVVIGVWSDKDGPDIRAALRVFGVYRLPVRYLDGSDIPSRFKERWVPGEPVPLRVLREMQNRPQGWIVRDLMLKKMGWKA